MAFSKSTEYPHHLAVLSAHVKLIAHPARTSILLQLQYGPATLAQLSEDHPIEMVSLCRHLRILLQAGIVHVSNNNQKAIYDTTPENWPILIRYAIQQVSRNNHLQAAA